MIRTLSFKTRILSVLEFFRRVVRFSRASLDHHRRVAALVVLRLVGDGSHHVTTVEADGRA